MCLDAALADLFDRLRDLLAYDVADLPSTEDLQLGSVLQRAAVVVARGLPGGAYDVGEEPVERVRPLPRRLHLDAQVHGFDPHIIHAQHIWVQGQLALESGVPYVVNAWGPELIDSQHDARYRGLATQTAENAGRIFVPDEALRMQVVETFETPAETTLLINAELQPDDSAGTIAAQGVGRLLAVYQAVLDERFGGRR